MLVFEPSQQQQQQQSSRPSRPTTPSQLSTTNSKEKRQTPIICSGHTRPVVDLSFSKSLHNNLLLSCSKDSSAILRKTNGDLIGKFDGHKGCVWSGRLSHDGNFAVTGSADFTCKLWSTANGANLLTIPDKHIVRCVDISEDNNYIAMAGHTKLVSIYDVNQPTTPVRTLEGSTKEIRSLLFDSDRGLVFSSDDNEMRVWDLRVGAQVNARVFDSPITCLKYSYDKRTIISTAGTKVMFWDAETAELVKSFDLNIPVSSVALHPNMSRFAVGSVGNDTYIRVYDYENGAEMELYKGHHGPVHTVEYSCDGYSYATGSEDGTVRIWSTWIGYAAPPVPPIIAPAPQLQPQFQQPQQQFIQPSLQMLDPTHHVPQQYQPHVMPTTPSPTIPILPQVPSPSSALLNMYQPHAPRHQPPQHQQQPTIPPPGMVMSGPFGSGMPQLIQQNPLRGAEFVGKLSRRKRSA